MDTNAESGAEGEGPRVVKRYANRKLYDTRNSRYVTLQQIADFVRHGEDVRIIDNKSKEDLTDVTLAQIIYEEQKNKVQGQARSLVTLRGLIQRGGERIMTTLRDGPVGKLVPTRDGEQDGLPVADQETTEVEPDQPSQSTKSLIAQSREAMNQLQRLGDERIRAIVGKAADQVRQLHAEIRRLESRIEELEERLRKVSRGE